ncbi:hypothetical protein MMC07_005551, partial [Pseudocyphellaria aurata]|nr:hypothetical protein [Pseudocyphellaria aurata]
TSHAHLPKVFTTLRERYLTRPGGYTRVLRIESLNRKHDQAPSAILELVDGPKDMRFAMTARTIMRERAAGDDQPPSNNNNTTNTPPRRRDAPLGAIRDFTAMNIRKVTRFRPDGLDALEREVARLERLAKEQEKKDRDKEKREKETETRESREKGKLAERNVI